VSKRILLIDSDESFSADLVSAITARGFTATAATDSEQGMSLAKEEVPDLIVVCVEAQPTNGYMLCTRLKKDEQLKGIPVILTSANATADSFEKHKKLKTRAEEYLIKPFEPQEILDKASALLGVEPPGGDEEILSVEDESISIDDLSAEEDEPISLSAADAAEARNGHAEAALEIEEVEEVDVHDEEQPSGDEDLELFDKAFESLGSASSPPEQTTRFSDLQASPAAPRRELARPARPEKKKQPTELTAPDDDAVLNSLEVEHAPELAIDEPEAPARISAPQPPRRSASPAASPDPQKARENQKRLEDEIERLKAEAAKRESAAAALQQRADALSAAAKKFEREVSTLRDEAKKSGKGAQLEAKVADLEAEVTSLREQVATLTGEKEVLGESRDELKKLLDEAQSSAEQNEDRAVKAYGRIKAEEKLREKARKALQIALQLLEESGDDDDDSPSKKLA
jgi:CheY-like chemotaxis protein